MSVGNTVQKIFWICWTASKDAPFNAEYRILNSVLCPLLRLPKSIYPRMAFVKNS